MSGALVRINIKTVKNLRRRFQTSCVSRSCILDHSPNAKLNKHIADKFLCLPMPECKMIAEYIWLDGTGQHLRSKSKSVNYLPACVEEYPKLTFNGNLTYQTCGLKDNDMFLVPAAVYNDPFRRGSNKLVLCEVYNSEKKPCMSNNRSGCAVAMRAACHDEPMYEVAQEFTFIDYDGRPYGWPIMQGQPRQGDHDGNYYYAGVGGTKTLCRDVMECVYRACLYAGVEIGGMLHKSYLSQWEYQTGPTIGIKAADDVLMSRYILNRVAEEYGLDITLNPKPIKHWPASGCHIYFSSKGMREDGGLKHIEDAICRLSKRHIEHLVKYSPKGGEDNIKRLDGKMETSNVYEFTSAVGVHNVSVRICSCTVEKGKGSFEDRRPAANVDPYSAMEALTRTILIDDV